MTRYVAVLGTILAVAGQPSAGQATADMNVTRVALFSSGVGYFECSAEVAGTATAELSFRTDQINDILKSLVVQDFSGGTIGAVSYASRDPIEKTLKSFGVDITGKPTLGELLNQLRGQPVEIAAPRALKGVIVGVEKRRVVVADKNIVESDVLNLLTETGLEQFAVEELRGVRLTNEKVDGELRKALATLATAHDADKKSVVLRFEGQGTRKVRAAYLLEAPIWKTSYRLVLENDKPPFLQGWATVENATEKDWNDVRLSLVSGRPISFRMDLYTPIYIPRPLEQLELYASLRPPEYEAGFAERKEVQDKAEVALAARARGRAAPPAAPAPVGSAMLQEMDARGDAAELTPFWVPGAGVASVATAQEAGELFEYLIRTPVTIPRQHSAMLPIVNQPVAGDKVSIYNSETHPKHPLNGLELTNATGLHLMQGPVTVFDGEIYAGDAKLPDLKPDEKRLVAYALDLSTEVMVKQQPVPEEIVSLRIAKGTLWHRRKYVDQREYVIRNKLEKPRVVVVEHPYSDVWRLVEPKEPYERTPNLLRFKVGTPAKETTTLKVVLERIADESVVLASVGLDTIRFYLNVRAISPAVKQALEKVIALRNALAEAVRLRELLERQVNDAVQEQARVRENLKTLQRDTDPYQRQLKKFDELETSIGELRARIDAARAQEEQKRREMEEFLLKLEVE